MYDSDNISFQKFLREKDINGNTALHFATMNDNIDVLYFLLEKGLLI